MKFKITAIITMAITALCISACHWFDKSKQQRAFIEGNWQIDSVAAANLSGNHSVGYLLMAMAEKEGGKWQLRFSNDSLFTWQGKEIIDRHPYSIDMVRKEVSIKDSIPQQYHFELLSDSVLVLTDKDSVSLFLKRR